MFLFIYILINILLLQVSKQIGGKFCRHHILYLFGLLQSSHYLVIVSASITLALTLYIMFD